MQHEDAAKNQAPTSSVGFIGRGRALSLANVRENLESTAGPSSPSSYPGTLKRSKPAKAEKQRVNLMVNVQAFMCPVGEPAEVPFYCAKEVHNSCYY